jgi:hypothetical protein
VQSAIKLLSESGAILNHTYIAPGNYTVPFTAEGLDGKAAEKTFSITVGGSLTFPLHAVVLNRIDRCLKYALSGIMRTSPSTG